MKSKQFIKNIKKQVLKSLESDLKNSVLKELYGSEYKKEIKKFRKQILKEIQREIFGKKKGLNVGIVTNIEDTKAIVEEAKKKSKEMIKMQILAGIPVTEKEREEAGITIETSAIGGKFNSSSGISLNSINRTYTPPSFNGSRIKNNPTFEMDSIIKNLSKEPISKKVSTKSKEVTPERKQELDFFLGKLKEGASKLRKREKNINYRKKNDNIYTFTFERKADFDLSFDIDLDLYSYRATINEFKFKIDEFKFDEKMFELIDIVYVLDLVGFNLMGYILEIDGVNRIKSDEVEALDVVEKETKKKVIRANTKVENFIDDAKIVSILNKNDIANYGQLKKHEDFTTLKGVGAKTAEKIEKFIKR